jgi:N-acetylglucosaminyldiphosphoundecaprenol N-acetyl-beta-D-mannosaminyltransferase
VLDHKFYDLLGIKFNALTMVDLDNLISSSIINKSFSLIAHHNLHSIYLCSRNPKMKEFYDNAQYIHIDGMPIVLLGKSFGLPLKREHRTTYADWSWSIIEQADSNGWRIFYLGSKPGVAEIGAQKIRSKYPDIHIATHHGYFDTSSSSRVSRDIVEIINDYKPHILMVGMGMPRQEFWIADNLKNLSANVVLPSGAAIDYLADAVPTPPRWSGKLGLEWLFRLFAEPKRLGYRYLIEPIFILRLLAIEILSRILKNSNNSPGTFPSKR